MTDVKWIKIATDIFDDDKILLIESMPEADAIIVIWFKLLCMAGKKNNSGVFIMSDKIAYTDEMLAIIFREPLDKIKLAIKMLEELKMVKIQDGVISIPNWGKRSILQNKQQYRFTQEYNKWRKAVFDRDDYTCQKCGIRGGRLNAHHIKPFAYYPELRLDINNGISLCEKCHMAVHGRRRRKNAEQNH